MLAARTSAAVKATDELLTGDRQAIVLADCRGADKKSQAVAALLHWLGYGHALENVPQPALAASVQPGYTAVAANPELVQQVSAVIAAAVAGRSRSTQLDECSGVQPEPDAKGEGPNRDEPLGAWRGTQRAWRSVSPAATVNYAPDVVQLCYALGSTPANAVLVAILLRREPTIAATISLRLEEGELRVTTLCGGSAAELVAIAVICDQIASAGSVHENSIRPRVHIDVVDFEPAWKDTVAAFVQSAQTHFSHIELTAMFHRCDLLDSEPFPPALQDALALADVVTLVYGLSELIDRSLIAAEAALRRCAVVVRPGVLFLVVDPVSLDPHGRKPKIIARAFGAGTTTARQPEVIATSTRIKIKVPATLYANSALAPLLDFHGLRPGHDLKLFTNSWYSVLRRPSSLGLPPQLPVQSMAQKSAPKTALVITPATSLYAWWKQLGKSPIDRYMVGGSDGGDGRRTMARVLREATAWRETGGVLAVDFELLAAAYTATDSSDHTTGLECPGLLVLDETQILCTTRRRLGKKSALLIDLVARLQAEKVVAIVNAAENSVTGGTVAERAENPDVLALVQHYMQDIICKPTLCPVRTLRWSTEDLHRTLNKAGINLLRHECEVNLTLLQSELIGNSHQISRDDGTTWYLEGVLARFVRIHPALLLTEGIPERTWTKCVLGDTGGKVAKDCVLAQLQKVGVSDSTGVPRWSHIFSGRIQQLQAILERSKGDVVIFVHLRCTFNCLKQWTQAKEDEALFVNTRWCFSSESKRGVKRLRGKLSRETNASPTNPSSRQEASRQHELWETCQLANATFAPAKYGGAHLCYAFNRMPQGCSFERCTLAHLCDNPICLERGKTHPRQNCPEAAIKPIVDLRTTPTLKSVTVVHTAALHAEPPSFSAECASIVFLDHDAAHTDPAVGHLVERREQHACALAYGADRRTSLDLHRIVCGQL